MNLSDKESSILFSNLITEAESLQEKLIALRRDFHKYPELAWEEMRTTSIIADYLTSLSFDEVLIGEKVCAKDSRMAVPSEKSLEKAYDRALKEGADPECLRAIRHGQTGVIGILKCGEKPEQGPVIALRFDIDALPITESKNSDHYPAKNNFRSMHEGIMHACGHDGHITVGLGTAELLARHRYEMNGTVKFIFQPAEEGVRGAKSIAENHHLDHVDYLLGAHMSDIATIEIPSDPDSNTDILSGEQSLPERAVFSDKNKIAYIAAGPGGSLATTKIDAIFSGTAAHAGMTPNKGDNALLAAVTAVQNLHAIPRYADSATRVNVGRIEGGTARNIICDKVRLELEVRGESSQANTYMEQYAARILESAAQMHNCQVDLQLMGSAKSVVNDLAFNKKVLQICQNDMGLNTLEISEKMSGSEDYSYLSEAVQAHGGQSCYFNNFVPCDGPFHSTTFDFDEAALVNGVKAFSGVVASILNNPL